METQKAEIVRLVEAQRQQGQKVVRVLEELGVRRSTYYSWRTPRRRSCPALRTDRLTPTEKTAIEKAKEEHPHYRHRQVQGVLQAGGLCLSASSVYGHLKLLGKVEPYARRESPWQVPRYEIWRRHRMWGADWTRLKINHMRWYLLAMLDFFSRYVVAWGIYPSIHSGHVRQLYQQGLKAEGIIRGKQPLPKLRVDRGSPNTAHLTQDFFDDLGAELSYARVHRPTDNAITERLFGTVKQEEIYLVGSYPDEQSGWEEIGRYLEFYHNQRPHQALWNFTPAHVHAVNNKSLILEELKRLKTQTKQRRKEYWQSHDRPVQMAEKTDSLNLPVLSTFRKT